MRGHLLSPGAQRPSPSPCRRFSRNSCGWRTQAPINPAAGGFKNSPALTQVMLTPRLAPPLTGSKAGRFLCPCVPSAQAGASQPLRPQCPGWDLTAPASPGWDLTASTPPAAKALGLPGQARLPVSRGARAGGGPGQGGAEGAGQARTAHSHPHTWPEPSARRGTAGTFWNIITAPQSFSPGVQLQAPRLLRPWPPRGPAPGNSAKLLTSGSGCLGDSPVAGSEEAWLRVGAGTEPCVCQPHWEPWSGDPLPTASERRAPW